MAGERESVTPARYVDMIDRKTARIFEVAARAGGWLGGADDAQTKLLERYGRAFGLAFQIHDDILDLTASTEVLGKPAGSDVRAGKKTLVALLAHERADEAQRKILSRSFGNDSASDADVAEVLAVFRATLALSDAEAEVERWTREATEALARLPATPARDILRDLAVWGATRAS
jgi:octaprenyl-diphosphate synthase